MKNLKSVFAALVLASVSFAGIMASANSGHVTAPNFVNELPEMTIVGTVPSNVIELAPMVITGSIAKPAHKIGTAHSARIAQIRVTDLEQGGAPNATSVIRFN
jgi:hypothetical protein